MDIFKIKSLSFSYPESKYRAIKDLNIKIKKGDFVTICGKSGCGKSTLLRHLKTILSPHGHKTGEVYYDNEVLKDINHRRQSLEIGYVFQNPNNQIVTDKVWHELAFGLESLGYDNNTIRLRVAEMASFFGIQSWFHKKVNELSGGQKQLLNLASIMAMQPNVLILDEPSSQLDPIAAVEFLDIIKKINRDLGVTIIITEHRLEEVLPISDEVIVMERGEVLVQGEPKLVAKYLKINKSDMFIAMPSSVKVVSNLIEDNYPMSIKDARCIIEKEYKNREIKYSRLIKESKVKSQINLVELKNIYFRYNKNENDIIKDLSININKGEFFALVGGNGSGKTTMLSLINGINKPYYGSIKINGVNTKKSKINLEYGVVMLPQNPTVLFVKKNVELDLLEMLSNSKLSIDEKKITIENIARSLEIINLLDRHPYDLSGGEQQKLALAKVLLLKPQILLLDEPTKSLDAHSKETLASILGNLINKGVTIIMVSHDIEFCAKYASRCALFFDGAIIASANTNEFFSGNSFYTTSANKITRDIFENAVTIEDVSELCEMNFQIKN